MNDEHLTLAEAARRGGVEQPPLVTRVARALTGPGGEARYRDGDTAIDEVASALGSS